MKLEFDSLVDAGVWKLTKCSQNKIPIGCRWILRTKYNSDGTIERRKARLVAKGYAQQSGIDFKETHAPVARLESIRLLTALAAKLNLTLFQLDITMAYTYGDLEEEIFMEQAEGFKEPGCEDYVYKLQKSLYGLEQSGRQWHFKLDQELKNLKFFPINSDQFLYTQQKGEELSILSVYVDDLIIATSKIKSFVKLESELSKVFKIKDLGKLSYCLGIEFNQEEDSNTITIKQRKYIKKYNTKIRFKRCENNA